MANPFVVPTALSAALLVACVGLAGKANARPSSASLSATPGVVAAGDTAAVVDFTGCGFQKSAGTTIVVQTPTATSFFGGPSDASGCIDISHSGFVDRAGTYYVQAWQDNSHSKSVLMASTTFLVS